MMFCSPGKFFFLFLLVLNTSLVLIGKDVCVMAREDEVENEQEVAKPTEAEAANDDEYVEEIIEDEAEDGKVDTEEEEEDKDDSPATKDSKTEAESSEEEEDKEETPKPSPDADTVIVFTKPTKQEFPAGEVIKCLLGLDNNGKNDFIVEIIEASLRYPQDYTYFIQNFTALQYNTVVQPGHQVCLGNGLLTVLCQRILYTLLQEGKPYMDAVFNETVNITESDEGIDGETFFLYVFLVAIGLLLLIGGHYALTSVKKKKPTVKPVIEMGTQQNNGIDYDWLPKETTTHFGGKSSPRRSPRNRRQMRNTGSDE
ncbi:PREDICTED: translocon-associated protein subunit alpha-like [Acropora digitifera]|uniref:translocon-associated protein subunit alpha-like n=1 Tax=Acropora digitifera TaxID=70779 RepID=UPI00077A7116|nr:PREDICTED: translocon-associated protein subunit alpha-like [Acropora digitifera]